MTKNFIARARDARGSVCGIRVIQNNGPLLGQGRGEFGASDLTLGVNTFNLLRIVLRELQMPLVAMEIITPQGRVYPHPLYGPIGSKCRALTIDFAGLNLR